MSIAKKRRVYRATLDLLGASKPTTQREINKLLGRKENTNLSKADIRERREAIASFNTSIERFDDIFNGSLELKSDAQLENEKAEWKQLPETFIKAEHDHELCPTGSNEEHVCCYDSTDPLVTVDGTFVKAEVEDIVFNLGPDDPTLTAAQNHRKNLVTMIHNVRNLEDISDSELDLILLDIATTPDSAFVPGSKLIFGSVVFEIVSDGVRVND